MTTAKRILVILLVLLGFYTKVQAELLPKFELDAWGNISSFWVNSENDLKYSRSKYVETLTLYTFTQEVASFDIKKENDKFYLAFETIDTQGNSKIFSIFSRDNGNTFSAPFLITEGGKKPSIAICQNFILIAWEENEAIHFMKSENDSNYFSDLVSLTITDEALSSPVLTTDQSGNISLCFLSQKKNSPLNQITYTKYPEFKTRVIYEGHDEIINLGIKNANDNLIVFWQNKFLSRKDSYFLNSINQGENFGSVKSVNCQEHLLDIVYSKEKLIALAFQTSAEQDICSPLLHEIDLPQISAPQIIEPSNNAILSSADLKLKLSSSSSDPLLFKISISKSESFSAQETTQFQNLALPASLETMAFTFPQEFSDGTYFLRVYASDGLSTSLPSDTCSFSVDTISPEVLSLEAEKTESGLLLKGKFSEPAALFSINGNPVSIAADPEAVEAQSGEAGIYFEQQIPLGQNENEFTFILTDFAGNQSVITREVSSLINSFDILLLTPGENEWFKPGSTIFMEADVAAQYDIEDEKEASVILNDDLLENSLFYSKEHLKLFGFIDIPNDMVDGKYPGSILLEDLSGSEIKGDFTLNIDGTPPALNLDPGQPCYGNHEAIYIPLSDAGAGIDPYGTILKISDVSFEGTASYECGQLIIKPDFPLHAGTYNAEITPRDLVGNTGNTFYLNLIVDSTAPMLTLVGTYETVTSSPKITIQGSLIEENPSHATIFINKKEAETFSLTGNQFSNEIDLVQGRNEIIIEVFDKSNNKTTATICTTANFSQTSGLISKCIHGPNPFSPKKDLPGAFAAEGKGMVFSYSLSEPADIHINIYDITGTLIWTKRLQNTASGVTAWSGEDAFGKIVGNGIYPYIFSAKSASSKEIKRGKILVIR